MTATDPQDPFDGAPDCTILPDCLDEIFAAGRMKTALLSDQVTEGHLINAHQSDEEIGRQLVQKSSDTGEDLFHECSTAGRR